MTIASGTRFGRYEIISPLGAGAMGEVYLALDTKLDRKVALKILPSQFAKDADRMSRFVREAKSASALNHPNIITIHEIGESDGTHFIATEFIDGKTLNEYAKDNSLNYKSALEIAIQVVSALDEAHQAGIIHRDIKPDNVMVRANGLAKILDFGIAKLSAPTSTDGEAATVIQAQTQAGMIIGTPNYMSPEQARGLGVDQQTDIFSFGVVLYEMLAGVSPFKGETVSDVIAAVLTKEPPRLTNVPPELADILDKTLRKDKRHRYQSAKDLLDDLKEAKEELAIQSRLNRVSLPNVEEPQTQILQTATTGEESRQITSENLKSIAVLPFTNMSADEDNEYFCDGLAEELLNALSKIEDLKVAARTSAFSFKGKHANVSEVGAKLAVKNVLEGSVRRSGDKLRISVQLVNAADGYQLWSERYDREMRDIFDVQDEIALVVVDALKLKLFGDEKAAVLKKGTESEEAYEFYLKGRFFFNKFTRAGLEKAVEYYEQATAIDANYALAFVGVSEAYFYLSIPDSPTGYLSPREALPKVTAAAERAIEIDEQLAEAWAALAHIKEKSCDLQGAKEAYRRSFELNANHSLPHSSYGAFLSALGEHEQALQEVQLALGLDPFSVLINSMPLVCLNYARRYDEAIAHWEKIWELELTFPTAGTFGGLPYLQTKRYREAIKIFRQALENSNRSNTALAALGHAFAVSGNRTEAEKLLHELLDLSKVRYVSPYGIALVYVGLGENDKAIESLVAAYEETNMEIVFLNVEPRFDPLRGDSRFQDIIRRIGLPTDKTNRTDESLEAKTIMLRAGEVTSEPPAKYVETKNAETKPTIESATNPTSEIQKPKSKWWLFGLLSLIVLVGGFFGYRSFIAIKQIESIAVMPFVNESGNADVEYLSDGMTETLISSLSNLPNLNVKPRSSVFRYKGKDTNPQTIGKELNVQAILNGRVVQRGQDISLFVELIDISLDKVIWSETYSRKQSDLVTLQSDIARDVSSKLKTKLSGAEIAKVEKTYTTNPEAYQLYLKGKYHFAKKTKDDILKGIEYFQQAIKLDTNFAMAYVGIADSYNSIPSFDYLSPKESIPKAKLAAQRALEIDPTLAEAHTALAASIVEYDWDWEKAELEFRRALELNPNAANTHFLYGINYLVAMGRTDEAIVEIKRATELEPLNVDVGANLAAAYMYDRQLERSLEQALKIYDLDPNFVGGRIWLATMYAINGKFAEAIAICEKDLLNDPTNSPFLTLAGYSYAKNGQRQKAEQVVERLQQVAKTQYVSHFWIAVVYSELGKRDEAFAELEKAYQEHDYFMPRLKVEPFMDSLRDDPRFKDLLKRMNLPE